MQRINVEQINDDYDRGAPASKLSQWERLLIVRFWPCLKDRQHMHVVANGHEQLAAATNTDWLSDPPQWADADGSAKVEESSWAATEYMSAIIDRQLSKASGLLSLNAVLLAVFAFTWSSPSYWLAFPALVGSAAAIVSVIWLVEMHLVGWGTPRESESHRANLRTALRSAVKRTRSITSAVRASLSAIGAAALIILIAFIQRTLCLFEGLP